MPSVYHTRVIRRGGNVSQFRFTLIEQRRVAPLSIMHETLRLETTPDRLLRVLFFSLILFPTITHSPRQQGQTRS